MSELREYFHIALALGLFLVVYRFLWKGQRISRLRDDLFRMRQELFAVAASEKIAFTHPAYIRLRELLNANIRYAHKATGARVLVRSVVARRKPGSDSRICQLCGALRDETLPADVRGRLLSIHYRMDRRIAFHLLIGSPFFTFLAAIYNRSHRMSAEEVERLCPGGRLVRIAQVSIIESEAVNEGLMGMSAVGHVAC